MSDIVVSSRVRLARNYDDLPFRSKITREQSEECVQRTLDALRPLPQAYSFYPLRDMEANEKRALMEAHLISPDLMEHEDTGAVLIRADEKIAVMMNEEDHLRLQAFCAGENLRLAAAVFVDCTGDAVLAHLAGLPTACTAPHSCRDAICLIPSPRPHGPSYAAVVQTPSLLFHGCANEKEPRYCRRVTAPNVQPLGAP